MKYTSLTHYHYGLTGVIQWENVVDWEKYFENDKSFVWSKIYETRSGILVESYWPDEFEEYRMEGQK